MLTNTLARRVLISSGVATGVELASGEKLFIKPGGQVILSAGAYRTPQLLMLSGIGDPAQLARHGIPTTIDLPAVGRNLHDHLLLFRYWKLRHPEAGLALGSPKFNVPNHEKGGPTDWLVTSPLPTSPLKAALEKDAGGPVPDDHPLLHSSRPHLEMNLLYATFGASSQGLDLPLDGTSIMTYYMACLPTSRGTITLASDDPAVPPVIDPNYLATEADRHVMREGFRMHSQLMLGTDEGRNMVVGEHTPPGFPELGVDASDAEVDSRVEMGAGTVFHPGGTAAMGRVVDTDLKVVGVQGLRVVDASVVSGEGGGRACGVWLTKDRSLGRWRHIIRLLFMRLRSRRWISFWGRLEACWRRIIAMEKNIGC